MKTLLSGKDNPSHTCPCGSGLMLKQCCQNILDDHANAATPEMLMRSRYTAYVLNDKSHLLRTWSSTTRPSELTLTDCKWINLDIVTTSTATDDDSFGTVTFTALCLEGNTLVSMKEESRFVKERGKWYYLDGDLETSQKSLSGNTPCPCGSGKKYKRCCK